MQELPSPRPIFKHRLTKRERFAREAMIEAFGFRGLGVHPGNQNLHDRTPDFMREFSGTSPDTAA